MDIKLERILSQVQKPGRYTGGEYRQIIKDKSKVAIRIAFCFPDTYEIGMSNLGLRILYGLLNEIEDVWCERVFAPWVDMENQMREAEMSLYGLESGDPLKMFDIVAFSLGYELSFTNVFTMLDLSGISLRADERKEEDPLIIAGGMCCFNPEPLSEFMDLMVIGDGEDMMVDVINQYRQSKNEGQTKNEFLKSACTIGGVYVPSFYDVSYKSDGKIEGISSNMGAMLPVMKRNVDDMDNAYFPVESIMPSIELVHDRVVLELFRGCIRGCRFCQAGYIGRPHRSRSSDILIKQGIEAVSLSGYDELALLSLSTSDYEELLELCDGLLNWCEPRSTSISLPSLRADNFSIELMERIQKVRKSGLTFAPEAGTQRLRDVINKNLTEEDLFESCKIAFQGGWNGVKLYFMLGLPTETDEDVLAIAALAQKVYEIWKEHGKNKNRGVRISISTSCFIPKPHTPFQWEEQISNEEYLRRVYLLRDSLKTKAISYSWHSPQQGRVEAALARGDRRMGDVLETAWQLGARMDSWSECFDYDIWIEAFNRCGIDIDFYAAREREYDEILPWSLVSAGVSQEHFWRERELSRLGTASPNCKEKCANCGVCSVYKKTKSNS
ncbi:MAG: TIGR03960 family B12-binding radical SAM protein [Oscillospiraceae bacterium]|nr:TIGR03960 family B12-binding radical SAM protein [Oscillospiraceae bacterium]